MAKKTAKKPEDKKSTMPERPTTKTSSKMPARRKPTTDNRDQPEAKLRMAEVALSRVQDQLGNQMRFRENSNWDCETEDGLYDRLEALTKIYDAKGLVEPDLNFDWDDFRAQVIQVETDIFTDVARHLTEKGERMFYTGRADDDTLEKLWAKAESAGDRPRDIIRGFSELIRKLRTQGCADPEEQARGGRQQGGNRRGRG